MLPKLIAESYLSVVRHRGDSCKRFNTDTLTADQISALLKRFFDNYSRSDDLSACRLDEVDQSVQRTTLRKKIVDNKNFIIPVKKFL